MEVNRNYFNVVNLLSLIMTHWRLALSVLALSLCCGAIIFFSYAPASQFVTILEIGSRMASGEDGRAGTIFWEPESVTAEKTQNVYIPQALANLEANDGIDKAPDIAAKIRDKTPGILYLTSVGLLKDRPMHQKVHAAVVSLLTDSHKNVADIEREVKERSLLKARGEVEVAQAQEKSVRLRYDQLAQENADRVRDLDAATRVLELRRERLADSEKLLRSEMAALMSSIDRLSMNQADAIKSIDGNEPRAMTLLMLGNEIQQYRARHAALEERLHVALPKEQDAIDRELVGMSVQKKNLAREYEAASDKAREQIADVGRQVSQREAQVQGIFLQLKNFLDTRVIGLATPSRSPIGLSRRLLALIIVLLSLVLSLTAVLLAQAVPQLYRILKFDEGSEFRSS